MHAEKTNFAALAKLDFGAASLLEGVGKLQDARFAKGRAEDLQTDRQLAVDLAAGYGNPGNARK